MTDWQLALLTAGVTTVGTVLVTLVGHWLTVGKDTETERNRRATYIATRVVCMLDPFVLRCVDVVFDEGTYHDGELEPVVSTPTLAFPEDLDWRAVDSTLMYRILRLPNEVLSAERTIAAHAEYSGPPDYEEVWAERKFQYGRVGLLAFDLADDLRRNYRLPRADVSRWNPRYVLDAAYTVEDDRRKRADENIKRMIENHNRRKADQKEGGAS